MKDLVNKTIQELPSYDNDKLVHIYKCASSTDSPSKKALFKPLMAAIEKERRKRGTVTTISSKPIAAKSVEETSNDNKT